MSAEPDSLSLVEEPVAGKTLRVLGWFSVGITVAAVGVFVGCALRSRYKFNQRTPYDFYSNAGESQAAEFGVGI
jgi:hypothetical protein